MISLVGFIAAVVFLTSDAGRLTTGALLIFLAESFVGLLVIAALFGVFK
jgi:hypothetical protein